MNQPLPPPSLLAQAVSVRDTLREPEEPARPLSAQVGQGIRAITPDLILLAIVTGAAFALGSGLVHRYIFKEKK